MPPGPSRRRASPNSSRVLATITRPNSRRNTPTVVAGAGAWKNACQASAIASSMIKPPSDRAHVDVLLRPLWRPASLTGRGDGAAAQLQHHPHRRVPLRDGVPRHELAEGRPQVVVGTA